jgi:hypothetical protein
MSNRSVVDGLLGPDEPELGCDECFEYLDRYVEAEFSGSAGFEACPACTSPADCASARNCHAMAAHLEGCPACAEEYGSLRAFVAGEDST